MTCSRRGLDRPRRYHPGRLRPRTRARGITSLGEAGPPRQLGRTRGGRRGPGHDDDLRGGQRPAAHRLRRAGLDRARRALGASAGPSTPAPAPELALLQLCDYRVEIGRALLDELLRMPAQLREVVL